MPKQDIAAGKSGRRLAVVVAMSLLFVGVLILCYYFSRLMVEDVTLRTIRSSTESAHGDMVLVASRPLESEIASLILRYESEEDVDDWSGFATMQEFVLLDEKVRSLVRRTKIVKLKVYATNGVTIYSSDPAQVGEEKSEVEQVVHALRGRSTSQVAHRDQFMSFDGRLDNVEIVSSYHPLVNKVGETIGVIEIYSDRTAEFGSIRDYGSVQIAKLMVLLSLALALWLANIMFGALRQRDSD